MLVRDIMTANPVACTPTDRVVTAAKIMVDRNCGAVPVVDSQQDRHVVGMLTDRDIVCRLVAREQNPAEITVGECMTAPVHVISPVDSAEEAARLMEEHQIRRLPVVEQGDVLVGIVATADLARKVEEEELLAEVFEEISEPALAGTR